ncbi:RimJ/RimL family protein N-acetyltransferase [Pedobacter sp. AK017]|uniref:GNAT family N-acetyltransferase n=1 Tax=Pedobacter sp. AK017 TaxID=2723073 RepID=UPI00160F6CFF|nr:GNAT family N-acetyltransferase [Pedobacter sp. AK017]MBB5439636.1 RimJ/RimL family protein N-acetyltransferase [Pedobacter sp. AK017]
MEVRNYRCLKVNRFILGDYELVPIRDGDKFHIMKWRNEQIDILRQLEVLTKKVQQEYFSKVIDPLFNQSEPKQILFSFLHKGVLCGYGGLVHINWIDKNAEISFLMQTDLQRNFFALYWEKYLYILFKVAFEELGLNKIYTYAFDLRPKLYEILVNLGFVEEARLKEHCRFNNQYIDVLIHSKFNVNAKL